MSTIDNCLAVFESHANHIGSYLDTDASLDLFLGHYSKMNQPFCDIWTQNEFVLLLNRLRKYPSKIKKFHEQSVLKRLKSCESFEKLEIDLPNLFAREGLLCIAIWMESKQWLKDPYTFLLTMARFEAWTIVERLIKQHIPSPELLELFSTSLYIQNLGHLLAKHGKLILMIPWIPYPGTLLRLFSKSQNEYAIEAKRLDLLDQNALSAYELKNVPPQLFQTQDEYFVLRARRYLHGLMTEQGKFWMAYYFSHNDSFPTMMKAYRAHPNFFTSIVEYLNTEFNIETFLSLSNDWILLFEGYGYLNQVNALKYLDWIDNQAILQSCAVASLKTASQSCSTQWASLLLTRFTIPNVIMYHILINTAMKHKCHALVNLFSSKHVILTTQMARYTIQYQLYPVFIQILQRKKWTDDELKQLIELAIQTRAQPFLYDLMVHLDSNEYIHLLVMHGLYDTIQQLIANGHFSKNTMKEALSLAMRYGHKSFIQLFESII